MNCLWNVKNIIYHIWINYFLLCSKNRETHGIDYSPKCLNILGVEAALQLLYQLEEQRPSWLGNSHHIVPWLADGHLTLLKDLCSSRLHVCSTNSPRPHLEGVGRSFPAVSITLAHDIEVWNTWGTHVPEIGWMMVLVEAWEQVFGVFQHWNFHLGMRIQELMLLWEKGKMQKLMQFLQIHAHMNVVCKQKKYNIVCVCNACNLSIIGLFISISEVSSPQSGTDAVKLQK